MSARAAKSIKSSTRGRVVKVDTEDDSKLNCGDIKEISDVFGLKIPLGVDLEPIPHLLAPVKVKKDEPSDTPGRVKHEENERTNIKPEDTKQEPTKREVNMRLSLTQVWEHDSNGQHYIPRPSPARNKLEDAVDAEPVDFNFEQGNFPLEGDQGLPPRHLLQASPPPSPRLPAQPSLQPSPQPQRQARRHFHDGRALPGLEVLLPRLEDVRRRWAARAAQAQEGPRRPAAAASAAHAARENAVIIKPEPDDDVKPLLALEAHDPAEAREVLRTAVQNLRNPEAKVKKEMLLSDEQGLQPEGLIRYVS